MTNSDLRQRAEQIERLTAEIDELKLALAEAYDDAAGEGYSKSALRKAIKVHSMAADKRAKHDQEQGDLEIYLAELDGRTMQEAAE
ncbi:MAG: hypothetical protein RLZZ227_1097 [Pseudomonadota bacterium]|jgi:uncharacterized protein (UPF0335 family)